VAANTSPCCLKWHNLAMFIAWIEKNVSPTSEAVASTFPVYTARIPIINEQFTSFVLAGQNVP
jgi:hypothetical protein